MSENKQRVNNFIKKYGFFKFIIDSVKIALPSKSLISLGQLKIKYDQFYKLQKKYDKEIRVYETLNQTKDLNYHIWSLWLQGEDEAPEVARVCWNSVKRNLPEFDLKIITYDNLGEYVKLPDYIIKKHDKGVIGKAHFSDIIRTKLLIDYGGLWLDATVMCSDNKLIQMIDGENLGLFVYQDLNSSDITSVLSNWLIYSCKDNPILKSLYDLLISYWEKNDKTVNYFIYHMLFTIVVSHYKDEWKKIPVYANVDSHLLQNQLFEMYSKSRYDYLYSMTSFHKLTYKFDSKLKDLNSTFYRHIVSEFLE